jgi:hypothetical protein
MPTYTGIWGDSVAGIMVAGIIALVSVLVHFEARMIVERLREGIKRLDCKGSRIDGRLGKRGDRFNRRH